MDGARWTARDGRCGMRNGSTRRGGTKRRLRFTVSAKSEDRDAVTKGGLFFLVILAFFSRLNVVQQNVFMPITYDELRQARLT